MKAKARHCNGVLCARVLCGSFLPKCCASCEYMGRAIHKYDDVYIPKML